MRGATCRAHRRERPCNNFNPRSSCEERPLHHRHLPGHHDFNPRSSCEERPVPTRPTLPNTSNFNPRSSCEERLPAFAPLNLAPAISIHAPHARSDVFVIVKRHRGTFQSTLLMRGATFFPAIVVAVYEFQSTLLMRGATMSACVSRIPCGVFQSTLLMRGATHDKSATSNRYQISIHAPHARSDNDNVTDYHYALIISIHAPHARSDGGRAHDAQSTTDFNPRSSCEERLNAQLRVVEVIQISIHAPHARSDHLFTKVVGDDFLFQSTLLMRGATGCVRPRSSRCDFNPRSSCEERLYRHQAG